MSPLDKGMPQVDTLKLNKIYRLFLPPNRQLVLPKYRSGLLHISVMNLTDPLDTATLYVGLHCLDAHLFHLYILFIFLVHVTHST